MVIEVTGENFDKEVNNSDIPVLVDFWASWCAPCRMIAPYIEEVGKEYQGKIKVCKVNVDEAGEIASRYQIMSIPTLMVFSQGKILEKKVGSLSKKEIENLISPYIST